MSVTPRAWDGMSMKQPFHACSMQASKARRAWREQQGAVTIFLDECDIRVDDARLQHPSISVRRLSTESSPSRTLVSEMMIMAGEIAAQYGQYPMPGTFTLQCLQASKQAC